MTERDPELLEAREAQRLLQRAAQLQALADHEADARDSGDMQLVAPTSYRLAQVRSAALEVGISEQHVDAAWVDLRAERALPRGKWRGLASRFFEELLDAVVVRRVVRAPAREVLAAMDLLFPADPFRLTLRDQDGDPAYGGVLVFDIHGFGKPGTGSLAGEVAAVAIRQLVVTVRPIPGHEPSCEITARGPLAHAHHIGVKHGVIAAGVGGGTGSGLAIVTGAVIANPGSLLASTLGIAIGLALGVGGALGGGALGRQAYRSYCERGVERARAALEGLLGAVATRAEGVLSQASLEQAERQGMAVEAGRRSIGDGQAQGSRPAQA